MENILRQSRSGYQRQLFVYEYTCAALTWHRLPVSLRAEGLAMLRAVLEDFQQVAGVEVCTLLADDGPHDLPGTCIRAAGQEQGTFCQLAEQTDYTLVIAPESDGILAERCRWVQQAGGTSLGCTLEAIALTADKLLLAGHFQRLGIPTPPTTLLTKPLAECQLPGPAPFVYKPRDGAGSQATWLVSTANELASCLQTMREKGNTPELVLQPFVPGMPASVAFLIGPGQCVPLLPAAQRLSTDGRFRYLGGTLPLSEPLGQRAVALAQRAVSSIPGLRGYVGVDLVLGTAKDGSGDVVIEINPRLTTSYIGLRRLARDNLARTWLQVLDGEPVVPRWWEGVVCFEADGRVEG